MLDIVVRVEKQRPDSADAVRLRETDHRLDPFRRLDLGVVVQEQDEVAVGVAGPDVVDAREVERFVEPQHFDVVAVENL